MQNGPVKEWVHKLSKKLANSKPQRGDRKKFPHWGSTNIWRHRTNLSGHSDLAIWICAPLF